VRLLVRIWCHIRYATQSRPIRFSAYFNFVANFIDLDFVAACKQLRADSILINEFVMIYVLCIMMPISKAMSKVGLHHRYLT